MNERRRGLGRGLGALLPPPVPQPSTQPPPDSPTSGTAEPTMSAPAQPDGHTPTTVPDTNPGAASQSPAEAAEVTPADKEASSNLASTPTGAAANEATPTFAGDTGLLPVPGARFAELPVSDIRPNPRQPRTVFDEDELAELSASIREVGVLQPVVVRLVEGGYELIMGERRWRATAAAGLAAIPAIIRETTDDDLLRDALLENLHRSQLNPLEEAAAYAQLLEDFGCTQDELATRIGRSRPQISNTLRLLRLPPLVQRRVAAGVLSAGHARALLGLSDGGAMERLAQRIVAEGMSVRTVEEIVALGDADQPEAAPRARRPAPARPELGELESTLSDFLDTRAKIVMGARKGRVTIEFATLEDLGRILTAMGVDRSALTDAE